MKVQEMGFNEFVNEVKNNEGIVLLGAGGDTQDWINGVTDLLKTVGIVKTSDKSKLYGSAVKLITSGGRTDLALVFKDTENINMGKLALWRIHFGECHWISDYVVNYANQH